MKIPGWRYYNHAALPSTPPHQPVDLAPVQSGEIWTIDGGKPLLVRWTTDFDCGEETSWWYVIKDTPFDPAAQKAKRRYEINKGKRHFDVRPISAVDYVDEICRIQVAAYACYPAKYRPSVNRERLAEELAGWRFYRVYGAFSRDDGRLCGYSVLNRNGDYISMVMQKALPESEGLAINAAIVATILEDHEELLRTGGYLCDGARNVQHETHFQDYLEKYFGFRKAYCHLHLRYHPRIAVLVRLLFPFRSILRRMDGQRLIHRINGVLRMEELRRGGR